MASKEVPQLNPAGAIDGTEEIHVVQAGQSRRKTLAAIFAALDAPAPPQHYHYGSFAVDTIAAGEVLMEHIVATAHTLADELADNVAIAGTPPADGNWIADVQVNGASIGSLTISIAGAITWTTTAGAVAVDRGDVVTLVGPAVADSAIARVCFTFKGVI